MTPEWFPESLKNVILLMNEVSGYTYDIFLILGEEIPIY